jgi:hypothetical protein
MSGKTAKGAPPEIPANATATREPITWSLSRMTLRPRWLPWLFRFVGRQLFVLRALVSCQLDVTEALALMLLVRMLRRLSQQQRDRSARRLEDGEL